MRKVSRFIFLGISSLILAGFESKPATESTKLENARASATLPFGDKQDFENAKRGFIAPLPNNGVVKNKEGRAVWDASSYSFIKLDEPAPVTVNPSLWRQAQLLSITGLFQVTDKIYQVRGYDISNVTFIEGEKGITVVDPLVSAETAKASLDLYFQHRPKKPILAVIYTHSHVDHYGGVKGLVSEQEVKDGKVRIIAPEHFTEEAVSESVMAGNAMARRASYMYGPLLPKGAQGQTTAGLGLTTSSGQVTLIVPTETITKTGQTLRIDGLTYEFQMAPGTEAPAEMHFFIRELKALCPAENACHTLHNLYTLRGAKTRDAKAWAHYLDELLDLFADKAEVMFAPHHWPIWGNKQIVEYVEKMRDTFKYIHDQTLRLANHGYTMTEIAEMLKLPPGLEANWASHGYYGSVNHNAKAVYNYYLGWFDANPATLHPLPPAEASKKYVEFMGGKEAVLAKARKSFEKGDFRWTAQVVNHVVLADPANQEARYLLADAYEQLAYQTENGTWRNFYLTGAMELRNGVKRQPAAQTASLDSINAMNLNLLLDYLGVRLNGPKAVGKKAVINLNFTDTDQKYMLSLNNSVLNYSSNKQSPEADSTVFLSRPVFTEIIFGQGDLDKLISTGQIKIDGNPQTFRNLLSLLDSFDFWFDIVTPNPQPK